MSETNGRSVCAHTYTHTRQIRMQQLVLPWLSLTLPGLFLVHLESYIHTSLCERALHRVRMYVRINYLLVYSVYCSITVQGFSSRHFLAHFKPVYRY